MKTLLLIRHAKSAAFGTEPGDHNRPLKSAGQAQTDILAAQLIHAGRVPDLALVSTALRTQQTWAGLATHFKPTNAQHLEQLYLASAKVIETEIWRAAQEPETLAVIGHNPGIAMLAWQLLETGSTHETQAEQTVRGNFKTAYAACFDMSGAKPRLLQVFDPRNSDKN